MNATNTNHCSIDEKTIGPDYSALTEEIESSHKALKFKVGDIIRIIKYEKAFRKGYTKNLPKKVFVIASVLKTAPWTSKIKDLNRHTKIGNFYEKELLLSKLKLFYY